MPDHPHYSTLLRWSEEDEAYLVALPEWRGRLANWMAATHGDTYEEAARMGQELLQMLIDEAQEAGKPLPAPDVIRDDAQRVDPLPALSDEELADMRERYPDQAWFWTRAWYDGEREVDASLARGERGRVYLSDDEFQAALDRVPPADADV